MWIIDVQMKFILPEIRCLKDIKLTIRVDAVDNMLKDSLILLITHIFKTKPKAGVFFDQRLINKKDASNFYNKCKLQRFILYP